MPRSLVSSLFGLTLVLTAAGTPGAQAPAASGGRQTVDFAADIQPMLEAKCLGCHGETLKLSKLDLRTRESAHRRRRARPGARAGQRRAEPALPAGRRARAAGHADARRRRSPPAEIAALKRWIDEGAHVGRRRVAARRRGGAAGGGRRSRIGRSPPRSAATGRSSCRVQAPLPAVDRSDFDHPIDRFLEQARAQPRADRRAARRSPHAGAPRVSRPARPAAVAGRGRRASSPTTGPTRGSGSSTRCWPRRTTANATAGTGSTSPATPTRRASSTTSTAPTPGAIATT